MQTLFQPAAAEHDARAFLIGSDALVGHLPFDGGAALLAAAKSGKFAGKAGDIFESHNIIDGRLVRVILLGIGGRNANRLDRERAGSALSAKYLTSGAKGIFVDVKDSPVSLNEKQVGELAFGALLRSWRIDDFRSKIPERAKISLESVTWGLTKEPENWADLQAVADGVAFTRRLVSMPANALYPESFVDECAHLGDLGVEITVLSDQEMKDLGMGALLGVAQGSVRPARLLAMRWKGEGGDDKPLVLVGKGVTFDTGGISLKPPGGMEDMKWDMGGAGAVAGTMKALASRKARTHVVGICGLVENMPDGNAQRPGDIVTSMSGQTIEVINTDAEGRLVLCDALHWAQENYNPDYVIDLATLTGAIIISLGHEHAGMFTNDDDLADKLSTAGSQSGDLLWRIPLSAAYDKLINSQIADMKNVGPRGAGSITAAQFLKRFVKDGVKWAHLDIAGTVWADKPGAVWDKGATGYGVRLLDRLIADNFER